MPVRTVKGLVVSERSAGESDKFISILTSEYGIVEMSVKGAKKITAKNHAAAQLLAYAAFSINSDKGRNYLNSSEMIRDFYNIRLDIKKLALACYMCEAVRYSVPAECSQKDNEVMRLVLNCLYMLSEDKRSCDFVKCVFEMRLLSEIGMMPDLLACSVCCSYEDEEMFFLIDKGFLLCGNDFAEEGLDENYYNVKLTPPQLSALRFICLTDMEKLFNFRLSEASLAKLCEVSEKYLLSHISRSFNSLDYYNSV